MKKFEELSKEKVNVVEEGIREKWSKMDILKSSCFLNFLKIFMLDIL